MMVAALLLIAGTASAQSKPNFAGKWTLVPDPSAPPPGGAGGAGGRGGGGRGGGRGAVSGPEVTIAQDATTLKVERMQGQTALALTFTIAGEGKNTMPGRQGGAGTEVPYKTAWEGNKFVITTTTTMAMQDGTSMTMTSKQALSIAADGTLVVESTSTPMGATEAVTTKAIYKKG
jgi:hypothetical protein